MKNNGGSRGLLWLIFLFSGQGGKIQTMLRRQDKEIFFSPTLPFLSQKSITRKMWAASSKALSKIWVNLSKCKSMLFNSSILMKMDLYQYFYEIFETKTLTRSKKYFCYAINCICGCAMASLNISGFFLFVLGNTLQLELAPFSAKYGPGMHHNNVSSALKRDGAFIEGKVTGW